MISKNIQIKDHNVKCKINNFMLDNITKNIGKKCIIQLNIDKSSIKIDSDNINLANHAFIMILNLFLQLKNNKNYQETFKFHSSCNQKIKKKT